MKMIAGRTFSEDHTDDPDTAVIISESASRLLGFNKPEDAIGQSLTFEAGAIGAPSLLGSSMTIIRFR